MILITGGAGFIGSNLVAALADRGIPVVVCDWLGDADKWRNLAKHELRDIVSPDALPAWLEERGAPLDAIVHLGAVSSTTERNVDLIVQMNFRLSWFLWEWCARHQKRFLYASSAATYGAGVVGFDDDGSLQALSRLQPLNAYGWSKHVFDRRIARAIAEGTERPRQWVGFKFFNVYGPNEYHKGDMQSLVAQRYSVAASGGSVALFRSHHPDYTDGGQMRDFVYVRDCVDVMLWFLEHPALEGLYNLGSGRARSFNDLMRAMFAALREPERLSYIEMPPAIRDRYQYFTEARMARLRDAGFSRAFTPLEDGVGEYVERYLATADRYR